MATDHGQLIPKYQHPSETTFIFDNTVVSDTENINDQTCRMLFVFASPKGRDNKLLEKNSLYSLVEEYGYPDYKRYGQPYYMPYTALASGNATGWCMRVMPDDAAYANVIYAVQLKHSKDTLADGTEHEVLHVKFLPFTQENLTDANLFSTYMETLKDLDLKTSTPDAGYDLQYPYIGVRSLGRGTYGEYFRVAMSHDVSSDKENVYKNYNFNLISTETGTVVKEAFSAINLTEDAIDPKTGLTTYISDVINDSVGDGSKRVAVEFKADYHTAIFNYYKENVDPDTVLTAETFDVFGYDRTREDGVNPYIVVDDGISSVALFSTTGIKLSSGSDGSLSDGTDSATKEEALEKLYVKAFDGGIDGKIRKKLRAPCNVCLDANYPLAVKKSLISLVLKRGDMLGYIDSGLLTTTNQILTFMTDLVDIDTYYISKNAGMFKTKDSVTGKVIPVTVTMWLAYKIPMHWAQDGMYTAMAAEDYATLSGYVKNSVYPEIDQEDDEMKEIFYKKRWNYIECIDENVYVRGTQQTSQSELSDLSEENNVHVMLQVKRRLERLCAQKRYHFGEASDRKIFTEDANELFSSWKGVYLRDINIQFTMNAYEEKRSILHCTCEIIFMTLIKRSVIEIDINPRA